MELETNGLQTIVENLLRGRVGRVPVCRAGPFSVGQPRSGIGWQVDHFAGYFVLTLMFCAAWPRPFLVGGGLIVFAALLEALQAIPPDRDSNIFAVIYSAAGVLAAALIADIFIRARRQFQAKRAEIPKL